MSSRNPTDQERAKSNMEHALFRAGLCESSEERRMLRQRCQAEIRANANLEKILQRVEPDYQLTHRVVPRYLNHRRLREDLGWSIATFLGQLDRDVEPPKGEITERGTLWKVRKKQLKRIKVAAKKLDELLSDSRDEWISDTLAQHFHPWNFDTKLSLHDAQASVRQTVLAAEWAENSRQLQRERKHLGAGHHFLSVSLPAIFEKWFQRRAGRGHKSRVRKTQYDIFYEYDGESDSPYIRFALAVLDDYRPTRPRLPVYSAHTIATYLQEEQTGKATGQRR